MAPRIKSPTLSIALATYNGERHLAEQLQSLLTQSRRPDQLVISDDGSTDRTLDIARAFAETAPFDVDISSTEGRLGYRGNFMKAATRCTGDLISFCDQDDVWHPRKLETVHAIMAADRDVLMVFHNAAVTDEHRNRRRLFFDHDPCPALNEVLSLPPTFFPPGFSQTMRASLLRALPLWTATPDWFDQDQPAAHDLFFFALAGSLGAIAYLKEPLADYRQHGGSTFGFQSQSLSRSQHAQAFFGNSAPLLRRRGEICGAYARVPALFLGGPCETIDAERIARSTASWNCLRDLYALRADVRGAKGFPDRLRSFVGLRTLGGYRDGGFWTFGPKAELKDLVVGLTLGPIVVRAGRISGSEGEIRRGSASSLPSRWIPAPPSRG